MALNDILFRYEPRVLHEAVAGDPGVAAVPGQAGHPGFTTGHALEYRSTSNLLRGGDDTVFGRYVVDSDPGRIGLWNGQHWLGGQSVTLQNIQLMTVLGFDTHTSHNQDHSAALTQYVNAGGRAVRLYITVGTAFFQVRCLLSAMAAIPEYRALRCGVSNVQILHLDDTPATDLPNTGGAFSSVILVTEDGTPLGPGEEETQDQHRTTTYNHNQRASTLSTSGDPLDENEWSVLAPGLGAIGTQTIVPDPWPDGTQFRFTGPVPVLPPVPAGEHNRYANVTLQQSAGTSSGPRSLNFTLAQATHDRNNVALPEDKQEYILTMNQNYHPGVQPRTMVGDQAHLTIVTSGFVTTPEEAPSPAIPPFGATAGTPGRAGTDEQPAIYELRNVGQAFADLQATQIIPGPAESGWTDRRTWRIRKQTLNLHEWLADAPLGDPLNPTGLLGKVLYYVVELTDLPDEPRYQLATTETFLAAHPPRDLRAEGPAPDAQQYSPSGHFLYPKNIAPPPDEDLPETPLEPSTPTGETMATSTWAEQGNPDLIPTRKIPSRVWIVHINAPVQADADVVQHVTQFTVGEKQNDIALAYTDTHAYGLEYTNAWHVRFAVPADVAGIVRGMVASWAITGNGDGIPGNKTYDGLFSSESEEALPAANQIFTAGAGGTGDLVDETDAGDITFVISAEQANERDGRIRVTYNLERIRLDGFQPQDLELLLQTDTGTLIGKHNINDGGPSQAEFPVGDAGSKRWAIRIVTKGRYECRITITNATYHSAAPRADAPIKHVVAPLISQEADERQAQDKLIRADLTRIENLPAIVNALPAPTASRKGAIVWRSDAQPNYQKVSDAFQVPATGFVQFILGNLGATPIMRAEDCINRQMTGIYTFGRDNVGIEFDSQRRAILVANRAGARSPLANDIANTTTGYVMLTWDVARRPS